MVTISTLWLPILVSTVLVFVASSLIWMVLPHHRSDTRKLPDFPLDRRDTDPSSQIYFGFGNTF